MGWNWCRYGIWRKKNISARSTLYSISLLTCCRVKNGLTSRTTWKENIDQILKSISRSRSHLSHFVVDRRSQPQISHQVEHLWDNILQDWDQDSSWPLRHRTEEQSDWLSPVSFWPQCPPRPRLSPPSRDPGWSSRQAEKQKTRWEEDFDVEEEERRWVEEWFVQIRKEGEWEMMVDNFYMILGIKFTLMMTMVVTW